jgi:hypothetical protein
MTLRQMLYLSIQPEAMAKTRTYVKALMPWVTSTVVVTPRRLVSQMQELGDDVIVLADQDVLPRGTDPSQLDHVSLNLTLRIGACLSGALDDVFVMSDDDYRPIKHAGPERFVVPGPDGRDQLIGYSYYDLKNWVAEVSAFDQGQHNALAISGFLGAEARAYGSHQPQAIDRELFIEASGICRRLAPGAPVCEWATHFNVGRYLDPGRFTPARPYLALGWPEYPNLWRRAVVPDEYVFENFYPALYQRGYLYSGLSTTYDAETIDRETVEKLRRWRRMDLQTRRLDFNANVFYPTRETPKRYAQLRKLKREMDWLLQGQRAAGRQDPTFEPF